MVTAEKAVGVVMAGATVGATVLVAVAAEAATAEATAGARQRYHSGNGSDRGSRVPRAAAAAAVAAVEDDVVRVA